MPSKEIFHKPGSDAELVTRQFPLARCIKSDQGGKFEYIVKASRKSHMILGHGISAIAAWRDAKKTLDNQ